MKKIIKEIIIDDLHEILNANLTKLKPEHTVKLTRVIERIKCEKSVRVPKVLAMLLEFWQKE